MTKEQKDKILKALAEERNNYAKECNRRIATESGKITGADYMLQRFVELTKAIFPKDQYEAKLKADMAAILDKIRAELHATAEIHEDENYYLREE